MRSHVPTSSLALALLACGGPTPEPERATSPVVVDVTPPLPPPPPAPFDQAAASEALRRWLPAPPANVPYRPGPAAVETPEVRACLTGGAPRAVSFCLLKVRQEGGIPHLLDLGLRTRKKRHRYDLDRRWKDDAGGAENAGIVAAITSTRELAAMALDPRPEARQLALSALAKVPRTLESGGYVRRTTDEALRAAFQAVGELCAAHLGDADPSIVEDALACVAQAEHRPSSPTVAALAAYHPDVALRAAAAEAWPRTSRFETARPVLDSRVVEVMLARLREPMPARRRDDVQAREWTCHALWMSTLAGAPGVGEAAASAIREMGLLAGDSGRDSCHRLAKREGTAASPPKPGD